MNKYDYFTEIYNDIRAYLEDTDERDYNKLYDEMWMSDSVTGNASGSYTFNTYEAEENICHNLDLLADACDAFGVDLGECIRKGAEYADVTIRCHLLGEQLTRALEDFAEEEDAGEESED